MDDHPIVRKGLRDVLEGSEGFEVVGEAADGAEALLRAEATRPDVLIMDVMMPNKDGVEACREVLSLLPDTRVLILTASTDEDAVIESMAAGATGFVQKYTGSDELVNAVRQVADGRLLVPDEAVKRVFKLIRGDGAIKPVPKILTPREREILTQFSKGMSYAQIAEAKGSSMVTVRNAIYRVQDKLGLSSKQEIVVWAVRNGLLDSEDGSESC